MSIVLTEKAAKEVQKFISEGAGDPQQVVLRVGILAGGCSGFQYDFRLDQQVDPANDEVSTQHGVKVAVDKRSSLYLDGCTVDYHDGLDRRGFTFDNPNAVKSCGCGSSFSA